MKITYFGTTTLLFDDGKDQILFDAHVTRPSFRQVFFERFSTNEALVEKLIQRHDISRLRAIFVSHAHYDHVMDMPCFAKRTGADVYGSKSVLNVAKGAWVNERQCHLFTEGTVTIGEYRITILKSKHSKAMWYNDDLGKVIEQPLVQPARKRDYKEGGSYDFYIEHGNASYLIRPSFNYVEHELDGLQANVLFLGIAGLAEADENTKNTFFEETVEKVKPDLIIPIHWDNFFTQLEAPIKGMPSRFEDTAAAMYEMQKYCENNRIDYAVQMPLTTIDYKE